MILWRARELVCTSANFSLDALGALVLSVPAICGLVQRRALEEAAIIAGFTRLRFLRAPVGASLWAYLPAVAAAATGGGTSAGAGGSCPWEIVPDGCRTGDGPVAGSTRTAAAKKKQAQGGCIAVTGLWGQRRYRDRQRCRPWWGTASTAGRCGRWTFRLCPHGRRSRCFRGPPFGWLRCWRRGHRRGPRQALPPARKVGRNRRGGSCSQITTCCRMRKGQADARWWRCVGPDPGSARERGQRGGRHR